MRLASRPSWMGPEKSEPSWPPPVLANAHRAALLQPVVKADEAGNPSRRVFFLPRPWQERGWLEPSQSANKLQIDAGLFGAAMTRWRQQKARDGRF